MSSEKRTRDDLYQEASTAYGGAVSRIARAFEMDPDKRRDLLQEMHFALWRSFETFEGRCSLLTWVYRVAHHTATAHVIREHRAKLNTLVTLEDIENRSDRTDHQRDSEQRLALQRLMRLIHQLRPIDRQVMLLYLEELDGASIAEITGLSAGHVRTQIHKIKTILARRFHKGEDHE
jgi:RNA polymerase sigma-70 factor (ECF subfamily)